MFATGEERSLKDFQWRCPLKVRKTGPLYLSCETDKVDQLQDYCKRQPMGVKKIKDVMKLVIRGTTLGDSVKSLSN